MRFDVGADVTIWVKFVQVVPAQCVPAAGVVQRAAMSSLREREQVTDERKPLRVY
jgi:hypothetical protein